MDAATKENESKVEEMQLLLEESEARAKTVEASRDEELVECAEEIRSLQDTIEKLQQEMKERESALQQDIADVRGRREKETTELEEQLTNTRALYSTLQEDAEQTEHKLKELLDQKDFQVLSADIFI